MTKKYVDAKQKRGFTLAEVLITLGIIGVVAAMTIPTLMSNIGENIAKNKWKKAYSVVSQAYSLMLHENGGNIADLCSDAQCLSDLMKPYLKTIKDCNSSNVNNCWAVSSTFMDQPVYAAPAAFDPFGGTPGAANVLTDGMVLGYHFISQNCADTSKTGIADCGAITVDIDGSKGKHVAGTDLFAIHMQATGLVPYGIDTDNRAGQCNETQKQGCAAKYLYGDKDTAPPAS